MLSRLVITFLPSSKCLLISWLQSTSAVILEPPKIKSDSVSTVFPSISHEAISQRIARETRKPSSVINAKKWRKAIEWKRPDLFKKIRDTKGKIHAKMNTIKDVYGTDLTEAEDIKKR